MNVGTLQQIEDLRREHAGLTSLVRREHATFVAGTISVEATTGDQEAISDAFEIEILIPNTFPKDLPQVKEIGGRIPTQFGHVNPDGTLCLGVPIELRRAFSQMPTLAGFVENLVIPYLYAFVIWQKHGRHPFGEADHGNEGIARHYVDALKLADELSALALVTFLAEHGYRGHLDCPCGSGAKSRACHGAELLHLWRTHNRSTLRADVLAVLDVCLRKFGSGIPKELATRITRLDAAWKLWPKSELPAQSWGGIQDHRRKRRS